MKICHRAYEYLQVCNGDGTVRPCTWSSYGSVGRLTEESMYEIMHGEKMEEWMNSILDGSYHYCDADQCPYLANHTLEEHCVEYNGKLDYPLELSISYDNTCNYMCPSCRRQGYINEGVPGDVSIRNFEKIEKEIRVFLNKVNRIGANGTGEVFTSPSIMNLLAEWKPDCQNPVVHLETNGSLFNEQNWGKIEKLGQFDLRVYITVMSFDNMAYQYLSGVKYDISRIEENLLYVKQLRKNNIINYLELATVVQERNFRTLPEFARRCIEEFGADVVRLRPYYPYGVYEPSIEWFFDIRNKQHPYHQEYLEVLKNPIFEHPKVYHWAGERSEIDLVNPGVRNTIQYNITRRMFEDESFVNGFSEYLLQTGADQVFIYAAGILGKVLSYFIGNTKIHMKGFIDGNTSEKEYRGIPVYRMSCKDIPKDKLVIVALPNNYECVIENLKKSGFQNVISLMSLLQDVNDWCVQ